MIKCNSVVLVSLIASVAIAGEAQKQDTGQTPKKELPVLSMDAFLSSMNTEGQLINTAPTSVLRDDAIKQFTEKAQKTLEAVSIEATVTIRDVRMRGEKKARISVTELHAPWLTSSKDVPFNVNLVGTVDLPLSSEQARSIRPGQKLLLRGNAGYHPGTLLLVSFPRPHTFARIRFRNPSMNGAVITLDLQQYRILNP